MDIAILNVAFLCGFLLSVAEQQPKNVPLTYLVFQLQWELWFDYLKTKKTIFFAAR